MQGCVTGAEPDIREHTMRSIAAGSRWAYRHPGRATSAICAFCGVPSRSTTTCTTIWSRDSVIIVVRLVCLHGWRAGRRRRSRRRSAQAGPVWRETMPASLASATAFCTEYLWELKRRPDIIGHRHRMTAHTDQWLWCTSMVLLLAAWLELPCTAGQKAVENHAFWCRNDPKTVQKRPAVTAVTAVTPAPGCGENLRACAPR